MSVPQLDLLQNLSNGAFLCTKFVQLQHLAYAVVESSALGLANAVSEGLNESLVLCPQMSKADTVPMFN